MPNPKAIYINEAGYVENAGGATNLSGLTDVTITSPTNGEALVYQGGDWVNSTVATTLVSLTDTNITSEAQGQILTYDASSSKWINDDTITGDITIIGDLYVSGTTVTIDVANLNVGDNIILVNSGETSAGVTLINAGIEVDRGTSTNYQFVFNETDDIFKVGVIGSLQAVATRQDTPTDTGVAYWDNGTSKFNTSANLVFDGTDIYLPNMSTASESDVVFFNTSNGKLTYGTVTTGTVTSVGGTGTVNGLTLTGTVTTTGNLTLGGTLAINNGDWSGTDLSVANGGTGLSTVGTDYILTGNGASALTAESNLTFDGSLLDVTGNVSISGTLTVDTVSAGTTSNVIYYDTSTSGFTYGAAPAGVSFGLDNQIPYTNSSVDDFDYSSNFTFDGTTLDITGVIDLDYSNHTLDFNTSGQFKTYNDTPPGSTLGNYQLYNEYAFESATSTSDFWYQRLWGYRNNGAVSGWEGVSSWDGISIDSAYGTPTTSKAWWQRDAHPGNQTWGDQSLTVFGVYGSFAIEANSFVRSHSIHRFADGALATPSLTFNSDLDLGFYYHSAGYIGITSGVIVNEGGGDYDFRIEGDTATHLFFLDAGNDRVGINKSDPQCRLDVGGTFRSTSSTIPDSGTGLEVYWSGSAGYIHPYDRTTPGYEGELHIRATVLRLDAGAAASTTVYSGLDISSSGFVFNENSIDMNFRVEAGGAGKEYMIYADAGTDQIHMGDIGGSSSIGNRLNGAEITVGSERSWSAAPSSVTDNMFFYNYSRTAGIAVIGGSISFSGPDHDSGSSNYNRRHAVIGGMQTHSTEKDYVGLTFWTHNSTSPTTSMQESMRLNHAGQLDVKGNVVAYSTVPSDIRLKENIETLKNPLDKITQLRGVNYNFKHNGLFQSGVIAQEVENIIPEVVSKTTLPLIVGNDVDEFKVVSYDSLVPYLIEAIKEQQKEINKLKEKLN